jgi:hypothetical protein
MLLFVVNSLVAVLGSAVLALRLPLGPWMRVVAALLLAQAWITFVLLVAGVGLRTLDAAAITAVNIALGLLAGVLSRDVLGTIPAWLAAVRTRPRPGAGEVAAWIRREPALVTLAAIVGLAVLWKLIQALRLPVLDYDGFSYHLVTVDVWLQSGAIGRVPQRIWSDGYPANGELITLWLMAFTRSDVLANLTAILALPLAMGGTAGLARVLGAPRRRATLAGLVVGGTPAVLALAASTYVDVWAMADVAAAACFGAVALRSSRSTARIPIVLAAIAIGLAVGTKASMAIPMGAVALVLVAAPLRDRLPWPVRLREAVARVALIGLPAVLFGGYWYVKNLVVFGDPFWPFHVGPFRGAYDFGIITQTPSALVGDPGIVAIIRSWLADIGLRAYQYDTRVGGFGVVWVLLLVLAIVGLTRLRPGLRPYVAVLGGAMIVTLLTMPMGWWPRLTLFVVVPVAALGAVALGRLPSMPARVLAAAVVVLTSWSVLVTSIRSNLLPLPGSAPGAITLARLIAAGDPLRVDLGLWSSCATITRLPAGSAVLANGFQLVHATVGHSLERRAVPPIAMSDDAATLYARLREAGATHVVLGAGSIGLPAATGRPDLFIPLGPTCLDAHVFALTGLG